MSDADRSTVRLVHYGRKSGKPYSVTIWFVVLDGLVWIGSMNPKRSWVRNLRAGGRGGLDFGHGELEVRFEPVTEADDLQRFSAAILTKHPIVSRILRLFVKDERCAFRTDLVLGPG